MEYILKYGNVWFLSEALLFGVFKDVIAEYSLWPE